MILNSTVFRSSKSVAEKLTDEERLPLILKAQAGDKDAMETLLHSYGALIIQRFGRYSRRAYRFGLEADDFYQAAYEFLMGIIMKFDPDNGANLTTYFLAYADRKVFNELTRRSDSFRFRINKDGEKETEYVESIEDVVTKSDSNTETEAISTCTKNEILNICNSELKSDHRKIIEMHYNFNGEGQKTFKEIADVLGTSHQNVQQKHELAIRILKRNKEIGEIYAGS